MRRRQKLSLKFKENQGLRFNVNPSDLKTCYDCNEKGVSHPHSIAQNDTNPKKAQPKKRGKK